MKNFYDNFLTGILSFGDCKERFILKKNDNNFFPSFFITFILDTCSTEVQECPNFIY